MSWVEVREPGTRRLLFKFDPKRLLVESLCTFWDEEKNKRVRFPVVTDLTRYALSPSPPSPGEPPPE